MNRLITIAICIFLTLILGVVFIYPKYQELRGTQERIRLKRAELQSKEKYFSDLTDVLEQLKEYEIQLSKIDSAIPPDVSLPALFNFLQTAASQNGLVLEEMSPGFTTTQERFRETSISLVVTGSYSSFKSFLSTLEKSVRMIELESISFSSPEETGLFTFNLRIKVHSY